MHCRVNRKKEVIGFEVNTKQINNDLYVHAYLGLIVHTCFFSKIYYVCISLECSWNLCIFISYTLFSFYWFLRTKTNWGNILFAFAGKLWPGIKILLVLYGSRTPTHSHQSAYK